MKKILSLLAAFGVMFYISSCSDDDDPVVDNGVVISGIPATATIDNLATLGPVSATVEGADGLVSLVITKDGGALETVDLTGSTTANYDFSYTAVEADADKNVVFTFTATDIDGDTDVVTHVLSVGAAPEAPTTIVVTENISEATTWSSDITYVLGGRITVLSGATLTIEPGTVIKGQAGTGANATALLVARGGRLVAEGTATAPIIFTSVADELTPADVAAGNFGSPNLDPDINGLWGGVIILGDGFISASAAEIQIEGIPPSDTNGLYGGDDAANDAGSIAYISIRHGGANIGSGNEINGLTLGGVGSGTTISNVEIVANQDDGIEWFGGDVSVTNALIWNVGDDAMDTDQGWNGTMNDFIIVNPAGSCFELDGPEGDDAAYFASGRSPLNHTFVNGTVYVGNSPATVDFDADGNVDIQDTYFFGYTLLDGDDVPVLQAVQEYQAMVDEAVGNGSMTGIEVTAPAAFTVAEIFVDVPAENVATVAANANTVGSSADYSWTWASQSGALAEIGVE